MAEFAGKFDYIVVGAGSAGCVLASRLAQDKNASVLLLEAGGRDDYFWIHIPVGYLYCIDNPRTDWRFRTQSDPGLNGRSLIYPRGKVLGGSSSINGMIYMRGQARDYDEWANLTGDPSWNWDQVLPIFKKSEDHYLGGDEMHGAGGEWRVEKQRLSWEILDAFREAAEQCGIPKIADFNRGDNEGSAYFEVNQKRGLRWNAAQAFLKSGKHRGKLEIKTGCLVNKLVLEETPAGKRCTGVQFIYGGCEWQARAAFETVLAAGAIGSPQILQLSGIGPGELLQRHAIPVVVDSPGVGGNLQDHLQLRMAFKIKGAKSLNTMSNNWLGKMKIGLEYALHRSGPMSMAPSQLGAFTKSDPTQSTANLEYHVQPLSLEKFGEPLHRFPAFTASVCNLRPTSRGFIQINSADPGVSPTITTNYLSTETDRKVAAKSIELTRRIVSSAALSRFAPEEFKPGQNFSTAQELEYAAGQIGTTIFHPVGTCKMGKEGDVTTVVDHRLRVLGVSGLRVSDASVMPTITSGNTNSPTIMIAEKAAAWIVAARNG